MKIIDFSTQEFTHSTPVSNSRTKTLETVTAALAFLLPAILLFLLSAK